jgi:hypothetical protein
VLLNTSLTSLNVSYNTVSHSGAKRMADALEKNTTIQSLNLTRKSLNVP